jgi:3D-(3,5/4)-trihydroxycyclohexane-1,2-dione acylhydrolase (decyclizing)
VSARVRLSTAQALVRFLDRQWVELDGRESKLVRGVFGIFGHGNVTGLGEALENEAHELPFFRGNNEQGMVHAATAYAKQSGRLGLFACTSSIGPGATNMLTAAATATINRLPVLLLPGDVFADRQPDPVLQQLEYRGAGDVSVNDCFRPVSRYFDRISRPHQLPSALLRAFSVLTDPVETGAVTLSLPQDVQAESWEFPAALFERRVWRIRRRTPDAADLDAALAALRGAERPLLVAGGGVHYSFATDTLARFAARRGVAVAETQAGKSAVPWSHPTSVGGIGVTGTPAANALAREADVVLFVGTRLSDFTTASRSLFGDPAQRRIHLNVDPADASKLGALPLVADAMAGLGALDAGLGDWAGVPAWRERIGTLRREWKSEVDRLYSLAAAPGADLQQTAVLGRLEASLGERDVVVCAAGSLPGDLHRLWRPRAARGYHLEYGYSCMGYEVAGALGAKLAEPDREVWALVGDGSFLMLHSELVTALQEGVPIRVVLFDNRGFQCIRGLQRAHGSAGFGNEIRRRAPGARSAEAESLPIDFAAYAAALGAEVFRARTLDELDRALAAARKSDRAALVEVKVDRDSMSGGYDSWWRVGVPEVSERPAVREAGRAMREQVEKVEGRN